MKKIELVLKRGPLFNNIAKNLVQNKSKIDIYGNQFPTEDSTAIRIIFLLRI